MPHATGAWRVESDIDESLAVVIEGRSLLQDVLLELEHPTSKATKMDAGGMTSTRAVNLLREDHSTLDALTISIDTMTFDRGLKGEVTVETDNDKGHFKATILKSVNSDGSYTLNVLTTAQSIGGKQEHTIESSGRYDSVDNLSLFETTLSEVTDDSNTTTLHIKSEF